MAASACIGSSEATTRTLSPPRWRSSHSSLSSRSRATSPPCPNGLLLLPLLLLLWRRWLRPSVHNRHPPSARPSLPLSHPRHCPSAPPRHLHLYSTLRWLLL